MLCTLQDLIGWFSYRRNSSHRLSMMEQAVHRQLAGSFKHIRSQGEVFEWQFIE